MIIFVNDVYHCDCNSGLWHVLGDSAYCVANGVFARLLVASNKNHELVMETLRACDDGGSVIDYLAKGMYSRAYFIALEFIGEKLSGYSSLRRQVSSSETCLLNEDSNWFG